MKTKLFTSALLLLFVVTCSYGCPIDYYRYKIKIVDENNQPLNNAEVFNYDYQNKAFPVPNDIKRYQPKSKKASNTFTIYRSDWGFDEIDELIKNECLITLKGYYPVTIHKLDFNKRHNWDSMPILTVKMRKMADPVPPNALNKKGEFVVDSIYINRKNTIELPKYIVIQAPVNTPKDTAKNVVEGKNICGVSDRIINTNFCCCYRVVKYTYKYPPLISIIPSDPTTPLVPAKANSISENKPTVSIQVYPNPTSDYINLNISNRDNQMLLYRIIDGQGRLVKESSINAETVQLDITNEVQGIYFIEFINQENKVISAQKIVKM